MRLFAEVNVKFLSKEKLLELISGLPDDYFFGPNSVGNLMVVQVIDGEPTYKGFIDFLSDGEYCGCK